MKKNAVMVKFILIISSIILFKTQISFAQEEVDYFTDNAFGNAIALSPGTYRDGVTYISYQGPKEHAWVVSYNHENEQWDGPYLAGESILGENNTGIDNHGRPSLTVDNEGYIHVFYGGHGGDNRIYSASENTLGNNFRGEMRHRVTTKPNDISSWEDGGAISVFGTYAQAVTMDNGHIYYFYRHGAHRSDWVFQRSLDNGKTFEAPVSILEHAPLTNIQEGDDTIEHAWYMTVTKAFGDRIDIVFNYHAENRPHNPERRNAYYMYMITERDPNRDNEFPHFFNVKDEQIFLPIDKGRADRRTLVFETASDRWANGQQLAIDRRGFPHIRVAEGDDQNGPKSNKYYRWHGSEWVTDTDSSLPVGTGRLDVHEPRASSLLIADLRTGVVRWSTTNGGATFTASETIYPRTGNRLSIAAEITDAHPDARFVIQDYAHRDYSQLILWGDNGIIQRNKDDAEVLTSDQRAEQRR